MVGRCFRRALVPLVLSFCALSLGGCGGVQFQGRIFDWIGMSGDRHPADVQMSDRSPLVIPPNLAALPAPGSGSAAMASADLPADADRERVRVSDAKAAAEKQREAAAEPNNPYAGKPTLLDKLFKKKTPEAPEDDVANVPEPDPSDAKPVDKTSHRAVALAPQPITTPPASDEPQSSSSEPNSFHPDEPDSYKQMSNPGGN